MYAAPVIGITCDTTGSAPGAWVLEAPMSYAQAVNQAGGVPLFLPQMLSRIDDYLRLCAGIILIGGNDPRMELFGQPTHAQAKLVHPQRQAFDTALLYALNQRRDRPALGICLGMQMMALQAGGQLHQHLPDVLGSAARRHLNNQRHAVRVVCANRWLPSDLDPLPEVVSHHHQAVRDAGRLRVLALAPDGTIEAVDDPSRPCYLGVQWHPERGGDDPLHRGLIQRFVDACRASPTP